jgi:hypothetical protein
MKFHRVGACLIRMAVVSLSGLSHLHAQDRQLPLEDVIKEKAGHLRLTGLWISGGAFDLRLPGPDRTQTPARRAYSSSAGLSVNWTYLGSRTNAWGNYAGDYSLASRSSLDSLSQAAEMGFLRRVTPRFSLGAVARAQSLNLGARLFSQPSGARQLQSPGFGGGAPSVGLGSSVDPVSEAAGALPNVDVFGLVLGGNQRIYTAGLVGGFTFTPRTDIRFGVSASKSDFPQTAGINLALPYNRLFGGYGQGQLRHTVTPRSTVNWSFQGGQSYAQGEQLSFVNTTLGISRVLSTSWYTYVSGGGGSSTVFREGVKLPWLFRYTGQGGLVYAGQKQGFVVQATQDTGDRFALGFESTTSLNMFWNLRPPASGWAFSARAGGVMLRSEGQRASKAGTVQLGLSRRLFGDIYVLGEATYVTNVLFAPQRLVPTAAGNSSLLDTSAQRAIRVSIVYRPAPDRK